MSLVRQVSSKKITDYVNDESNEVKQHLDAALVAYFGASGSFQGFMETLRDAIIAQVDENQSLIEGISSVGGQVDSSATAINQHTTTKVGEVLTALATTDAGSLRKVLLDAIAAIDLSGVATPQNVTDAQTAITDLLNSSAAGSIKAAIAALSFATPANVTSAQGAIQGASTRDLTQVYNLINALSVASPGDVTGARDVLRGASNRDLTQVYNLINGLSVASPGDVTAARDAVLGGLAEGAGVWNPKVKTTITQQGSYGMILRYPNLTASGWTTLQNISGSGKLHVLNMARCLAVRITRDGTEVLETSGDYDTATRQAVISPRW